MDKNSKIKALFFDIDGTLVSFQTHRIPQSTVEALEKAKLNGVKIYISTGRPIILITNLGQIEHLIDGYITTNGTDAVDDRVELRLSNAYEHLAGEPDLELKVLMLNVNEGHNKELMEQCQTLKEYAIYVARVRQYASEMNLNDAVARAIDECIKEGILVEFLRKNRSEVKMVSILEYDKEWEEKKLRKAEYEAGRSEGIEIGKSEGIEIGKSEGIEIGKSKGIEIGRESAQELPDAGFRKSDVLR